MFEDQIATARALGLQYIRISVEDLGKLQQAERSGFERAIEAAEHAYRTGWSDGRTDEQAGNIHYSAVRQDERWEQFRALSFEEEEEKKDEHS